MAARILSRQTLRLAAAAGTCAGGAAFAFQQQQRPASAIAAPAPAPKVVHTLSVSAAPQIAGDFGFWLNGQVKSLLELPSMLGGKILREPPAKPKPGVVFVLGGPGAGKGTQSGLIVEKNGYVHLSAGDLLRAERNSGSDQGALISEYIKEGKIVPVEITCKLLTDAIAANGGTRFLVDGFPRNTNNLSGWQQVAGDSLSIGGVLFYDCPEEVMEARLLERGKTSGRSDDNLESIKKRFRTYVNETAPVLAYYDHQGLVHKIDGTREVEAVWVDTEAAIAAMEARWAAEAAAAPSVAVHVYANDADGALSAEQLAARLEAAATKRWGPGKVSAQGRTLRLEASLKAYDLEALRAFD
jgi:UMP-CMP kinase